jgi:hypothetical protein
MHFLYSYNRPVASQWFTSGGISDLRTAPACDEGLACPQANPPRIAASIVMLHACRRWHVARLALPRADARKPPAVTARHCEIRC